MANGKQITRKDVETIKKWLEKGLPIKDVAEITDRSKDTVRKAKAGEYDYLIMETPEAPAVKADGSKLDEIIDLLNIIAERLGCGGDD